MGHVKPFFLSTLLILAAVSPAVAAPTGADEDIPDRNALADGQLTSDEIKKYAGLAAKHIQTLTAVARDEVGGELEQSGVVIPAAWMMMNDGEVKRVRLGESGEKAAATMKVLMFRAALKSLARHGKILATAIVYAGTVEEGENTRVLAIEHEHRLGLSGLQVVPYRFDQGDLSFGQPSTQKKPYELFYDGREAESEG
ncbi:hypothetical protein [Marinobacter sp. Arc7-DN-1]|uniref:hypothetical protein n=1 Tax=Marinobacter sp. Arc7-DN-1 TaxID=2304594 RepID=UPI000E44A938|nr:hypothetical protein [Marinobacter sp. Arc7-DN-1]AXS82053.1 hypothetical protein D0851_02745 [Marinobacter sp. Arc7-DN-1]